MRGGFVACLAPAGAVGTRLERAAAALRWHTGSLSIHRHGDLEIHCLTDMDHGPHVQVVGGILVLGHGVQAQPVALVQDAERFVALESDGRSMRLIRDPMGEVPLFYRRVRDEFWFAT